MKIVKVGKVGSKNLFDSGKQGGASAWIPAYNPTKYNAQTYASKVKRK